ncbi:hypothetical protein BP5796_12365 [Coleophoma crateriformis]|uniref:Zn(2)-C6 fungal-type domain-containing protein n=1 Tax=Coleophoma crateriformis TaxID=565419 RepID=A0A3D8Q9B6_9HELO|nr:hypothetical protein BP5796_12365 [Coleophoma crateriformis]
MSAKADGNEAVAAAGISAEQSTPAPKRAKRSRVQAACQRCQTRKQKCDGHQPQCSTCATHGLECRYISPAYHKPQEAKKYIKALENRVAELETALTNGGGLGDAALDHWHQMGPQGKEKDDGPEADSPLAAVRDVSLNTSGSFIGGTSTLTLARMLESILVCNGKEQVTFQQTGVNLITSPDPTSPNMTTPGEASLDARENYGRSYPYSIYNMQAETADKLLLAYFKHVAVNFPVVHSAQIKDYHHRRTVLEDPYEESILNLVYALGGQFLETTGDLGNYQWRHHHEAALEKREKILRLRDTRELSYLLLLIQLCVRVPRDVGGWTFVGIAMRLCVELGLHRKQRSHADRNLQSELEKRLFWACYYFDRDFAIALGRPPSISDHDIDVELPLDVDEECQDPQVFRQTEPSDAPAFPSTTLTCFLHSVRLKRIESRIQHKIYRVDVLSNNLALKTEKFLDILAAWKSAIPPHSHPRDDHSMNAYVSVAVVGHSLKALLTDVGLIVQMLHYHKCTRLLLQPQLYEPVINERYLNLCTEACKGICETYRRLHDYFPVAFSTLSLQTVFLAGLTLVYCMWHAPSTNAIKNMSALSDCSIILYIMTERWPNIKRYRDAFEAIKRKVLYLIAEDKHQPGKAIPQSAGDIWSSLQGFDVEMMENINSDAVEQMMSDMIGERMQISRWNDMNMSMYDASDLANENIDVNLDLAGW